MNERIKELSKQAKESVPQGIFGVDRWIEEYNKIFAKLVIEECAKFTDHAEELYKHFGIEK